MNEIKYKIIAEHPKKGYLEVKIPRTVLHAMADLTFMIGDCESCWDTFKLNKVDGGIRRFFTILEFLAFDVESDGYAWQMTDKKLKDGRPKMKKVKSDFVMVKKPKWIKKKK